MKMRSTRPTRHSGSTDAAGRDSVLDIRASRSTTRRVYIHYRVRMTVLKLRMGLFLFGRHSGKVKPLDS